MVGNGPDSSILANITSVSASEVIARGDSLLSGGYCPGDNFPRTEKRSAFRHQTRKTSRHLALRQLFNRRALSEIKPMTQSYL